MKLPITPFFGSYLGHLSVMPTFPPCANHSKYHPVMPTRPALLLIVSLSLSGCHNHTVPTGLQNHVSPNEVAVYQAYLQDSFTDSKYPHKMWYVETETWPYQTFCDEKLLKDGVQPAYLRALRDLGTASYLIPPFNMDFVRTFDAYRPTVNGRAPDGPFITQTLSRVAFSPDGRQAFFAWNGSRAQGLGKVAGARISLPINKAQSGTSVPSAAPASSTDSLPIQPEGPSRVPVDDGANRQSSGAPAKSGFEQQHRTSGDGALNLVKTPFSGS